MIPVVIFFVLYLLLHSQFFDFVKELLFPFQKSLKDLIRIIINISTVV